MADGQLCCIENIKVGNFVMGLDSKPKCVIETHTGFGEMFKVTQSKAISFTVNAEHILCLKRSIAALKPQGGRYPSFGGYTEMSVKTYLKQTPRFKRNFFGYRQAVDFIQKDNTINPYFLGLWLGDGSKNTIAITTMDTEVVKFITDYAFSWNLHITKQQKTNSKAATYRLTPGNCSGLGRNKNSLLTEFKKLNLIFNKHIPNDFLYTGVEDRLKLLAGIIDTDGSLHSNGFTIVQKDETLARQIFYLSSSLGFRTTLKQRIATIKSIGYSCPVWSIAIYGPVYKIPTKIVYKQAVPTKIIDPTINKIKSIISEGQGKFIGFSIEGDGRFFLEDFTVAHNSYSIAQLLITKLITENDKNIGICRKTFPALRMTAMKLVLDLLKEYGIYDEKYHNKSFNTYTYGTNTLFFFSVDEADKVKSTNFNYIWLEECSEFTYEDFMVIKLRVRSPCLPTERNQMFMSLNPSDYGSWVAKLCGEKTNG